MTASPVGNLPQGQKYVLHDPSQQDERERLDGQHQLWLAFLNSSLNAAPIDNLRSPKILDVGCGSGVWAQSFARAFPEAHVTGVDIDAPSLPSPTQNVTFIQGDALKPWEFAKGARFDYIHVRMLFNVVKDWPAFFEQCWLHMNPGGWIELNDMPTPGIATNPAANAMNSVWLAFNAAWYDSWRRMGWDNVAVDRHGDRLRLQGFINHSEQRHHANIGAWATTEPDRSIGKLCGQSWERLCAMIGPKMLMLGLGISEDEAKEYMARVAEDVATNGEKLGYSFPLRVNIAQRPAL